MKRNTTLTGLVATLVISAATMVSAAPQSGVGQSLTSQTQSSRDLLMLSDDQLTKFEQLWEYASGVRSDEEQKLAKKGPKASDRDRENARKKIVDAFTKAQKEAAKLLRPSQGPLIESRREQLKIVPEYGARQLLTWSVEDFLASPTDEEAARRWRASKDAYAKQQRSSWYRSGSWGFGFRHNDWHNGLHTDSHGTHFGFHNHHTGHGGHH